MGGPQGGPLLYRAAAPSSVPEAARPNAGIVRFHLVCAIPPAGILVGAVLMLLGLPSGGAEQPGGLFFGGIGLMCLGFLSYMVCAILRMVWFYQIWSWIPPSHRVTRSWSGGMTPAFAALGYLIPYFNMYWAFASTFATCDALEALTAQYTPGRIVPRGIGTAQAICSIVFFPLAPLLMHAFMKDVNRIAEGIDFERARVGALGPG